METIECIVIGAGAVGLACARAMALAGREVVIVEAESAIGTHTSSRNTGCIHAGIDYPSGSLKARLVLRGKALLYRYCPEHGVGHRRCGKMMVALDEARAERLSAIKAKAEKNGLDDLRFLDDGEVREMEPELRFHKVLYSPSSGIVDPHDLMLAYLGDAEDAGASLALNAPVTGGRVTAAGIELDIGGPSPATIRAPMVINAAGFNAQLIAGTIDGLAPDTVPERVITKGNYFVYTGKPPFSRLIYPLSEEQQVAVHVSPDMSGRIRFGPDHQEIDAIDYSVDPDRAPFFYEAARRFWPGLPDGGLVPGWAGIRPKAGRARASQCDFIVQTEAAHGIPGLINLYGIESPGLTSSMAIAEYVAGRLARA